MTVTWTCSDALSGAATSTATSTVVTQGAAQSATGTCFDLAGNSASAIEHDISIDRTPPTVSWEGVIPAGGSYVFDSVPAASTCTAVDSLSGPKDCEVTGYNAAVGQHTLTATAHDRALNTGTDTRTYEVLPWTLPGFRPPVEMDDWNVVHAGSTLPLKFQVFAGPSELTDTSAVTGISTTPLDCRNERPTSSGTSAECLDGGPCVRRQGRLLQP